MADELSIDEQYELIFGKTERPNIFSIDDEEYQTLRQKICETKREYYFSNTLPFSDVKLLSYNDYVRSEIAKKASNNGYRIFYIKQYVNNQLYIYAAGYFNPVTSQFFVLQESFLVQSQYFTHLINSISNPIKRVFIRNSFSSSENIVKQTKLLQYDSASLAASYFLGKKSDFRVWKDNRGKTLDAYYSKYKDASIDELEAKTFPDYIAPTLSKEPHTDQIEVQKKKHYFHIDIKDGFKANGYFDTTNHYFYICNDSFIVSNEEPSYVNTPSSIARKRFLKEACQYNPILGLYSTTKNAKCKSASAAACYVLGKKETYLAWEDGEGKKLNDFYPETLLIENETESEHNDTSECMFYISRSVDPLRSCMAIGIYDSISKKFILKEDSLLCLVCAPSFELSSYSTNRHHFINKYCIKENNGFRLKRDMLFDTPSTAACYVLGRSANGWVEWKNKMGITLDAFYRKQ